MEGPESLIHSLCIENAGERPVGYQFMFQTQHENSLDGLSLEFVLATVVGSAIFRMQGAEGCDRSIRDFRNLGDKSVPYFKEEKGPIHVDWRTTMHANGL